MDRGLVIFHVGGDNAGALTAYDVNTGAEKWSWKGDGPGYGSPVVVDIGGTRQIITITQGKLVGVDASNGALLWERPFVITNKTNSVTPVVHGRTRHRVGQRRADACAGDRQAGEPVGHRHRVGERRHPAAHERRGRRRRRAVRAGEAQLGPVFRGRRGDGKDAVDLGRPPGGHAAIARSGDLFLSLEDDGELVVARNSKTGFEPLHRYKVADAATWAQPAYSGNRVLVKDVSTLALWTLN